LLSNPQPLSAQLADTRLKTLYYQHLPIYFCAALTVMQSLKFSNSMNENLKDQDILLVREKAATS
jgi:hypothetical protein